jgi:hypothetical protein
MDFPKEGGYFINDWARAHQKTGEARFLSYIDVLASRYLRKMESNERQLIEFDSTRGPMTCEEVSRAETRRQPDRKGTQRCSPPSSCLVAPCT